MLNPFILSFQFVYRIMSLMNTCLSLRASSAYLDFIDCLQSLTTHTHEGKAKKNIETTFATVTCALFFCVKFLATGQTTKTHQQFEIQTKESKKFIEMIFIYQQQQDDYDDAFFHFSFCYEMRKTYFCVIQNDNNNKSPMAHIYFIAFCCTTCLCTASTVDTENGLSRSQNLLKVNA